MSTSPIIMTSSFSQLRFIAHPALSLAKFFFFRHTAPTEFYTLSLHDALPISTYLRTMPEVCKFSVLAGPPDTLRSEEHTSELQSPMYLVCRLLLEKKKTNRIGHPWRSARIVGRILFESAFLATYASVSDLHFD